jgi:DNA-binding beta-propeller fold protein YncE
MAKRTTSSSRDPARTLVRIAIVVVAGCSSPDGDAITLPDGSPGLGFDDLRWSAALGRVVVPGARSGKVYLVEPDTGEVTFIDGFGATPDFEGGHDDGPTSVDEGRGLLFVTDRTTLSLDVVDPNARTILSRTPLGASPDYVRWVEATNELWITEPAAEQIEIFALAPGETTPVRTASIRVPNGPESLVVDRARGRAYTHEWEAHTLGFDVRSRALVGTWSNGCAASRGIELEPEHGWVLAACNEGTLTVLDAANDGHVVSALSAGAGYDVMGYSRTKRHAYLAGSACGCSTIMSLSPAGELAFLARFDAPGDTHCVVADDRGHAFVCAPSEGALYRLTDTLP